LSHPVHSDRLKLYFSDRDNLTESFGQKGPSAQVQAGYVEIQGTEDHADNEKPLPESKETNNIKEMETNPSLSIPNGTPLGTSVSLHDTSQPVDKINDHVSGDLPSGVWHAATKLLAVKKINNERYYKVQWSDPSAKSSWQREQDITPTLVQEFHIRRTLKGTLRRKFKSNKRRVYCLQRQEEFSWRW
jgi:hypothetical protein